jgi:hypothetical protein
MWKKTRKALEAAEKAAELDRRIPVTAADHDDVTQICTAALDDAFGRVTESRLTRGGIVVSGTCIVGTPPQIMRRALESVGYVLGDDFGRNAVVVIGWDPARYSGAQMTVARIDVRLEELLAARAQLLMAESNTRAGQS